MNMHSAQAQSMMAAGLRDRLSLRLLRDSGEAPAEAMGFHAQQACEKFIKAVLVLHGVIFERTHDLVLLASLCAARQIPVPADLDALRLLNSFAVRFRYESCPLPLFDQLQAAAMVEELREWAVRELAGALGEEQKDLS